MGCDVDRITTLQSAYKSKEIHCNQRPQIIKFTYCIVLQLNINKNQTKPLHIQNQLEQTTTTMPRFSRSRPVTTTTARPHRTGGGLFGTRRRRAAPMTTNTTSRRGGLFHSSRPRRHHATVAPVTVTHHQKRRTSIGDKISGALMKLKGTITGRPGVKVCFV